MSRHLGWDWAKFRGSARGLDYARRDLDSLIAVLRRVPKRHVAVQAGGHLGIFPKYLAREFGVVYTFEPSPANFVALCRNCSEENVVRLQAALGDSHRPVTISTARLDGKPATHEGTHHVDATAPGGTTPQLTIDDLNLSRCDLIYLDVEGCEYAAVRGANRTLAELRPVVVVEVNKSAPLRGVSQDAVRAALTTRGYRHVETLISDEVYLPREMS